MAGAAAAAVVVALLATACGESDRAAEPAPPPLSERCPNGGEGRTVLSAAPTVEPDPAGVVDVSGPLDLSARVGAFGSAADVGPRIRSPVLLLWARGDHRMPPDAGRAFLRAVRGRDKATASFPGGWHGVSLLEGVPAASRMLLAFLRRQR